MVCSARPAPRSRSAPPPHPLLSLINFDSLILRRSIPPLAHRTYRLFWLFGLTLGEAAKLLTLFRGCQRHRSHRALDLALIISSLGVHWMRVTRARDASSFYLSALITIYSARCATRSDYPNVYSLFSFIPSLKMVYQLYFHNIFRLCIRRKVKIGCTKFFNDGIIIFHRNKYTVTELYIHLTWKIQVFPTI